MAHRSRHGILNSLARVHFVAERFASSTLGGVFTVALFLVALTAAFRFPDPDLFARLAMGKLVSEFGDLPLVDPFAFTAKNPVWIDHEWLSGVIFYWTWRVGGVKGLFLLKFIALALTVCLSAVAGTLFSAPKKYKGLALLPLIAAQYLWISTVRCQVFTYLFLPLLFVLLLSKSTKLILFVPVLFCIWANLHGGFVLGLGLFLLFCVSESVQKGTHAFRLWLCFLVSTAATGITPYSPLEFWRFILFAVSLKRQAIDEWQPISFFSGEAIVLDLLVLLLGFGFILQRKSINLTSLLLVSASCVFGFAHFRLSAAFVIIVAIFGASTLVEVVEFCIRCFGEKFSVFKRSFVVVMVAAVVLSVFRILQIISIQPGLSFDFSKYPVSAIDYLASKEAGGKVLINFNAGSYALWRLYPKFLVSMDGRYEEVYPESTVQLVDRALNLTDSHHAEALLEVDPDFIVVEAFSGGSFGPEWTKVFDDSHYAVFKKTCNRSAFGLTLRCRRFVLPATYRK